MAGIIVVVTTGNAVAAHVNSFDSVRDGEIRYKNQTKYDSTLAWGRDAWNAVGSTDLKPASASTPVDIQVEDRTIPSQNWDGLYTTSGGLDRIYLNTSYLDRYTTNQKRSVLTHELGHAYGLADHESSAWKGVLMYLCSTCSGRTTPSAHDISDWRTKWK